MVNVRPSNVPLLIHPYMMPIHVSPNTNPVVIVLLNSTISRLRNGMHFVHVHLRTLNSCSLSVILVLVLLVYCAPHHQYQTTLQNLQSYQLVKSNNSLRFKCILLQQNLLVFPHQYFHIPNYTGASTPIWFVLLYHSLTENATCISQHLEFDWSPSQPTVVCIYHHLWFWIPILFQESNYLASFLNAWLLATLSCSWCCCQNHTRPFVTVTWIDCFRERFWFFHCWI